MHALEAEPEKSGRWRRLAVGAVLALALGAATIFLAHTVAPTNKLFTSVMKIAIVDYVPPKPKPREEPPPPEPLPPKPKPKPANPAEPPAPPPPAEQQPQQEQAEPDIGLDSTSFGEGAGGPAFHVGTSQMGVPTGRGGGGGPPIEVDEPAPELREARPRAGNKQPVYSDKARRLGIEGLLVIEADIDARGRVVRAVVRGKLEPSLDEEARKTVLGWGFEPASLQGRAVPSTKFLRFKFELQ